MMDFRLYLKNDGELDFSFVYHSNPIVDSF